MSITLTPTDLMLYDREAVYTPGFIRPYGMMLIAELDGFHVRHIVGEIERRLDVTQW